MRMCSALLQIRSLTGLISRVSIYHMAEEMTFDFPARKVLPYELCLGLSMQLHIGQYRQCALRLFLSTKRRTNEPAAFHHQLIVTA